MQSIPWLINIPLNSNVPAGVVVIIVASILVPRTSSSDTSNMRLPLRQKLNYMDFPGLVIFLGLVTCLLLALTWGGTTYEWQDSRIIGLFVGFGLLAVIFTYWLVRRGDAALIPLRVLKKRSVYVGALAQTGYGIISVVVRGYSGPSLRYYWVSV